METTLIETYVFPAIWASYLINGDPQGLEQSDIEQCDKETSGLGSCIEVSENSFFGQFKGIGHNLTEYKFIKY